METLKQQAFHYICYSFYSTARIWLVLLAWERDSHWEEHGRLFVFRDCAPRVPSSGGGGGGRGAGDDDDIVTQTPQTSLRKSFTQYLQYFRDVGPSSIAWLNTLRSATSSTLWLNKLGSATNAILRLNTLRSATNATLCVALYTPLHHKRNFVVQHTPLRHKRNFLSLHTPLRHRRNFQGRS